MTQENEGPHVHLSDFTLPIELHDKLYAVCLSRGQLWDFLDFLRDVLADSLDGKAISAEERQKAAEYSRGLFEDYKANLVDLLATPADDRTPFFPQLLSSAQAWFRLNRRCPECGRNVLAKRRNRLFCSRVCNKRFYAKVWKVRRRRVRQNKKRLTNRR